MLGLAALAGVFWVVEPMRVSSASMAPAYGAQDQVLVAKVGIRARDPRRGDVIVLRAPPQGHLMIKRVVAVGGDRVAIVDGVLVVNGRRAVEPYVDPTRVDGTYVGPIRVRHGHVWVLGDDRADSVDSRTFGAVPADAIVGRVLVRLW